MKENETLDPAKIGLLYAQTEMFDPYPGAYIIKQARQVCALFAEGCYSHKLTSVIQNNALD